LVVNISIIEDRFIVIEDSGPWLDLSKIIAGLKKSNPILEWFPEDLLQDLKSWIRWDFSKDRIVRANLDEIIFILWQSTDGTNWIWLSGVKYLRDTKQCYTYVYDKWNEWWVVFVIDMKKWIDDTRESTWRNIVKILNKSS
jgi:hypothetical protein